MDGSRARAYFLTRPEAVEDFPFDLDTHVFKIMGKWFGLLIHGEEGRVSINLKCDPEEALVLRDTFASVRPGYHMNKEHWNTVTLDGSVPAQEIKRMIDSSYALVVGKLRKVNRLRLEAKYGSRRLYG